MRASIRATNGSTGSEKASIVVISAAATGFDITSPLASPVRASRHHCRRTSPGSGSETTSRTRAISKLKA